MPANYPFPQCWTTTQSYDIDFVGPVKYSKIGDVTYGYHRFGPTDKSRPVKDPVVLLAGFSTRMYIWPIPLLQRLAYDREVLIFDYPGIGSSKNVTSKAPFSIPMLGSSAMGLIKAMKFTAQPDLLGWGLGGMVALNLAATYSQDLGGILVYGGTAGGVKSFAPPMDVWKGIVSVGRGDSEGVAKYLFPEGLKDMGMCSLYASWNSFYRSKYTSADRLTVRGEQVVLEQAWAIANFYRDNSTYQALRKSTNRVLLLHGVEDQMVPVRNAVVAASRLTGSWVIQVPHAGHGVLFENVQNTIAVTLEFFAQADASGALTPDQLTWYSYGEQTPATAPMWTMAEVIKLAGPAYTAPSAQVKSLGNATNFLARARPESNKTVTFVGGPSNP